MAKGVCSSAIVLISLLRSQVSRPERHGQPRGLYMTVIFISFSFLPVAEARVRLGGHTYSKKIDDHVFKWDLVL